MTNGKKIGQTEKLKYLALLNIVTLGIQRPVIHVQQPTLGSSTALAPSSYK